MEELIAQGKIGEAGLCDLHPPVFKYIYNNAQIKPISIQVIHLTSPLSISYHLLPQINLKSCCVVPEELSVFAKEKAITLYTHSDPSELLPGDCLR